MEGARGEGELKLKCKIKKTIVSKEIKRERENKVLVCSVFGQAVESLCITLFLLMKQRQFWA